MFEGGVIQLFLLLNALIFGAVIVLAVQHFRAHQHQKNHPDPKIDLLPEATRKKLTDDAEHEYQKLLRESSQAFGLETKSIVNELRASLSKLSQDIMTTEMDRYKIQLEELRNKAHGTIASAITDIEGHQADLKKELAERRSLIDKELTEQATLIADTFKDHQESVKESFKAQHDELAAQHTELTQQLIKHQQDVIDELDAQVKAYAGRQTDFEAELTEELAKRREKMVMEFDQTVADTLLEFITESLGESVDVEAQRMQLLGTLEAHKKELITELSK